MNNKMISIKYLKSKKIDKKLINNLYINYIILHIFRYIPK